jgi:broad specificity phosphatase PhoE
MGAQIALIFSLFLLYRVSVLTVDRVRRTETWRSLPPHERPAGEHSLVRARERLQQAMLHFAKEASGVACVLLVASLAVSLN